MDSEKTKTQEISSQPGEQGMQTQVSDLLKVTQELQTTVLAMQQQMNNQALVRDAIGEVRAAARAVSSVPLGGTSQVIVGPDGQRPCDCHEKCDCLSPNCCEFEVWMTRVRVISMQLPIDPGDTGLNPWADMELRLFASIDGIGAMIPDAFSYLSVRKQVTDPYGIWHTINRRIGTYSVCCEEPKTVNITVDATELEVGVLEHIAGNRDEFGTESASMVLNCCVPETAELRFNIKLIYGGQSGGEIEVGFKAIRK